MLPQVFTFAKVPDTARSIIYNAIKEGKSRFGMWDQEVSLREQYHGANGFLLNIKPGDWIVHVNLPAYGQCVAVQVCGEYDFDQGVECAWGRDFCNYLTVDPSTLIEFSSNDTNVLPSVNLRPMRRGQRVLNVADFLTSIKNLKTSRYNDVTPSLRSIIHLRERVNQDVLPRLTQAIQEMNKGKDFEIFLHEVFMQMPHTVSVKNGFGWRTDHGADLLVDFQNPIGGVTLSTRLVVQAKSYSGAHHDLNAVDQIVEGMEKYNADGGLLITTGQATETLENYAAEKSEACGRTIDLIAGPEVGRFVLRHAPHLLIGNDFT